ncbi:hypothetical protein COT72_05130 [archaeon CG10_big_fil_rev_8_21_14_0_10_43_11]|nr:MAG: hypothetical protein COT72_05130 [archaeon CG10_big_fil_rev_8_21_14_0_10_43_11]
MNTRGQTAPTNITVKEAGSGGSSVSKILKLLILGLIALIAIMLIFPSIQDNFLKPLWEGTPGKPGLSAQFSSSTSVSEILSRFFGASSSAKSEDEVLAVRTQVKQVWETQYAAGQESTRSTSVDFSMGPFSITPFDSINGWREQIPISFQLQVTNKGNVAMDVQTNFACVYPTTPSNICDIVGVDFQCNTDTNEPEKLFFNDLPPTTPSTKTCRTVLIGENQTCDGCSQGVRDCYANRQCYESIVYDTTPLKTEATPMSWCLSILDEGGSMGLYEAKFQAYGRANFISRARIDVPIINREYATSLLSENKLTFLQSKAVNTENPVAIGMDVGQIPILTEAVSGDNVKSVLFSFGEPSDNGRVIDIPLFTLQIEKELLNTDLIHAELWTCAQNSIELDSIIPTGTGSEFELNDRAIGLKEQYTAIIDDYAICRLANPRANDRYSFDFEITDKGMRRITYLIGADMIYTYQRQMSRDNTITIDCSCTTFKETFDADNCIIG